MRLLNMIQRLFRYCLIGILVSLIFQQELLANRAQITTDSLRKILASPVAPDSVKMKSLNTLASRYLMIRPDSTRIFALSLLEKAKANKEIRYQGEAYRFLAISSTFLGQQKEALDYITRAANIFSEAGLKEKLRLTITNRASIESSFGDYRSSLKNYQVSLKMSLEQHDSMAVATNLLNLGVVYEKLKEYALAERNYKAALAVFLPLKTEDALSSAYNNLAVVLAAQKRYAEAMIWYRKGLDLAKKINDQKMEFTILNNIGFVYLETTRYDSAIVYQQLALEGRAASNDLLGMVESYTGLGEIHFYIKSYPKALDFLSKGLELADSTGSYPLQAETHKWFYKTYQALGNNDKALFHFEKHKALLDSIQQEEIRQSLVSQQYQLEIAQQEATFKQEKIRSAEAIRRRNLQLGGLAILALLFVLASVIFYRQRIRIQVEKQKSENLLLNILPAATAKELKEKGRAEVQNLSETTVLFSDFVGFTELSARLTPHALIELLNQHFSKFDEIMKAHGLEKIKTIGDAYMAAAGVPNPIDQHAERAAKAALAMLRYVEETYRSSGGNSAFQIRIGLHSGPVIAGIVGTQKFQYDIWGETVNKASRMESSGQVGSVNLSEETWKLIQHQFTAIDRGEIETKGLGKQRMYLLTGEKAPVLPAQA